MWVFRGASIDARRTTRLECAFATASWGWMASSSMKKRTRMARFIANGSLIGGMNACARRYLPQESGSPWGGTTAAEAVGPPRELAHPALDAFLFRLTQSFRWKFEMFRYAWLLAFFLCSCSEMKERRECESNSDCAARETCVTWKNSGWGPFAMTSCSVVCEKHSDCQAGETCAVFIHGSGYGECLDLSRRRRE